jgi:hypothetical protein
VRPSQAESVPQASARVELRSGGAGGRAAAGSHSGKREQGTASRRDGAAAGASPDELAPLATRVGLARDPDGGMRGTQRVPERAAAGARGLGSFHAAGSKYL